MMKLRLVGVVEKNSFYDPDKANNGGGYSQHKIDFTIEGDGRKFVGVIEDTSCGDFGDRIFVEVKDYSEEIRAYYGDMIEKEGIGYSDFDYSNSVHLEIVNLISEHLGYRIPDIFEQ